MESYFKLDFISIALILLHISQCTGQQLCRHTTFIELQSKHQSSLEYDDDISFTKEGTITITAAAENMDYNNDEVLVSIKDTGIGIDPEILPRLFTKFATKSVAGTGLGLFISKNIVEAHEGKMWAENNADGEGATFAFSLSLSE